MRYKCKKCDYEFNIYPPVEHSHSGMFIQVGCPICLKVLAMPKVCPKCGSKDLEESLAIKES